MCKNCGCDSEIKKIKLHDHVLADNDHIAEHNRDFFNKNKIVVLNFMSSPGSGKTSLLSKTLIQLKNKKIPDLLEPLRLATLVGDQTTDLDAQRLQSTQTWVHQINTFSSCHLDANHIYQHLPLIPFSPHFLFIENIGNLVCPASFDLGEHIKVALISTPEGEDKPLKYPVLFNKADIILLTKTDLIPHLNWSTELFKSHVRKVNATAQIFELSSQTEEGLHEWTEYLFNLVKIKN